MSASNTIPVIPIVLPLLGAGFLSALRKWLKRSVIDGISIAVALGNLGASLVLLRWSQQQTIVYWFGNWHPRGRIVLGISFVIDPASAGLAALAALLTVLALLYSWRLMDTGSNHYQPLMLIFLAGMSGFSLTGDLFNLFVFFELMSTAAFALCGLKTREPSPLQGAFNFAVTNTIAAFLVLTGIGLLYAVTGALNMAQIGYQIGNRHDPLVLFAGALLVCGFFIKAAIVPFHLWLPDAHAVAPTPVCVLFSGLMVELGLYAVLRIHVVIFANALDSRAARFRTIMLVLGIVTAGLGAVMCYAEHHLKRLLAFSTISHTGLMLIALAIGSPVAIAGMLLYLLGHAFAKSGLFFTSGIILHRLRSVSERTLFARGKDLHWTALLWFLGGLGLASMPPFVTLSGESLAETASHSSGLSLLPWVFVFVGAITAAAVFRVGVHTFFGWGDGVITDRSAEIGELPETSDSDKTICWFLFLPAAICIIGSAALTFVPGLRQHILTAAERVSSQSAYISSVYGQKVILPNPKLPDISLRDVALRCTGTLLLAICLVLSSISRRKLPRYLRLGAYMEGPLHRLRNLQSGHPSDYVVWLTVGVATVGWVFVLALR